MKILKDEKMARKGLSQSALTLILGIFIMLFVLVINTAFAPAESFKEFLKKVPFLNRIVPEPGADNPVPIDQIGVCMGICENKQKTCEKGYRCVTGGDPKNPLIGKCEPDTPASPYSPKCDSLVPSGNVLRLSAVTGGGEGVYHTIYKETGSGYTIASGDCLEYDVWIANDAGGIGGIDIKTSDGKSWGKDESGWKDENGQKAALKPSTSLHTDGEDISQYAYRRWYHRKIRMFEDKAATKTMVGRTVESARLVVEQAGYSRVPVVAYYDNVKITRCNDPLSVKKVIFDNNLQYTDPNPEGRSGFNDERLDVVDYGSKTDVPDYHNHGAQVLKFTASNPDGKSHVYWRAGGSGSPSYIFQPGDTIEYDVCVVTNSAELGGIDIFESATDNKGWRDIDGGTCSSGAMEGMSNGWRDQNLVGGHPKCDLRQKYSTTFAFNKWYHRVMIVPREKVGAGFAFLDLASETSDRGDKVVYYDNIFITNADKVAQTIYQDDMPAKNEKHFADKTYTATLEQYSPPDPSVCAPADPVLDTYIK